MQAKAAASVSVVVFVALGFPGPCRGQAKTASRASVDRSRGTLARCCAACEADLLVRAAQALRDKPDSDVARASFVLAFPRSFSGFQRLFGGGAGLRGSGLLSAAYPDYLGLLSKLADSDRNADDAGRVLVEIASRAHLDVDAPGDLHRALIDYAAAQPQWFANNVESLPASRRAGLISFISDVEFTCRDPIYRNAVASLRRAERMELASALEAARRKRCARGP